MKYLKFGYGRGTDDASTEIRHGRMSREEGIEMVRLYDAARPLRYDTYLRFLGMTETEFEVCVDSMRDGDAWEHGADGAWRVRDWVGNHAADPGVEAARVPQVADRTLAPHNRHLYWQGGVAAAPDGSEVRPDVDDEDFIIL
jgi:hypothetical protein